MPARTALLTLALLAAAAGLWWNRVHLSAVEPTLAREGGLPVARGPADVSLEAHPERVADGAQSLRYWAPKLTRMADAWMENLGIDFHVVTLASDAPLEAVAPEIFELRRVGERAPTGGLLLLIDPERGEARIEVSYALEAVFPDALVGRVARDQLVPYASYSAVGMAIMDVLKLLKDVAFASAVQGRLELAAEFRAGEEYARHARFLSGGGGAQVEIPELPADADLKARVEGARRARYAPSADPRESLEAFLRARADLAGDPTLELFTPGSQEQRARYPLAPYEELQRLQILRASQPLQLSQRGDRAVFTSAKPASGFIPVLMHRSDGLWRVDLVEVWKNFRFTRTGEYVLEENASNPYLFALRDFPRGRPSDAPLDDVGPLDLEGNDLRRVIRALEERDDALSRFLLGELLYRNCFASVAAILEYERAVELAPSASHFRRTLARRALFVSLPDLAIPHLRALGPGAYALLSEAYLQKGDRESALQFAQKAVDRNPYDRGALTRLFALLQRSGKRAEAAEVEARLAELERDPRRRHESMMITFEPARPILVLDRTTQVRGQEIFDWSDFAVTLTNESGRAVEIEHIVFRTQGTHRASGLGDIKRYWSYPSGRPLLRAGESVRLQRIWGFSVDTEHTHIANVFEVCWRGVGEEHLQCDDAHVQAFPL